MIASDQLLRDTLCDIRIGAGVVAGHELDLDARRQVLLMLLDVELDALVELVAGLRERTGIGVDKTDLDGLRRRRHRERAERRGSEDEAGDLLLQHRHFLSRFILIYRG